MLVDVEPVDEDGDEGGGDEEVGEEEGAAQARHQLGGAGAPLVFLNGAFPLGFLVVQVVQSVGTYLREGEVSKKKTCYTFCLVLPVPVFRS